MSTTPKTRSRPQIATSIVAVLWAYSALAGATDYALDIGMSVNASHDDNIRLVNTNETALTGAVATPSLGFDANSEQSTIGVDARMDIGRYDDSGFNSNDIRLSGNWALQLEKSSAQIQIIALRDSTTTSEILDSGRIGTEAERHAHYQLSPTWSYALTETDSLQLHADASRDTYDSDAYYDYRNWSVNLDWTHALNERLSAILRALHSDYRSDPRDIQAPFLIGIGAGGNPIYVSAPLESSTESRSSGAMLGLDYDFAEQHQLSVFAGSSRVTTEYLSRDPNGICESFYSPLCDQPTQRGNSFNTQVNWSWSDENDSASLNISKSNQPSSDGYPLDAWRSDASWTHQLSERDTVATTLSWGRNRILDNNDADLLEQRSNRDYGNAAIRYNRRLNEAWQISSSVQFRYQNYTEIDYRANSHVIALAISYQPQTSHWSR